MHLIRTDSLTCARYFEYRYREILKFREETDLFGINWATTYYLKTQNLIM